MPLGTGKGEGDSRKMLDESGKTRQERDALPGENPLPNCRSRVLGIGFYPVERNLLGNFTLLFRQVSSTFQNSFLKLSPCSGPDLPTSGEKGHIQ